MSSSNEANMPTLSSQHEGFALELVISKLLEGGYRRIALQFPDEHLPISITVYEKLLEGINNDDIDVFIIGDSTFGSSVDDVSAQHVDADVLLYFGSDLSSSGTMPVMIIPYQKKVVDVDAMVTSFLNTIDPMVHVKQILLLYEPGYHHCINALSLSLRKCLDQIQTMNETQVIAATLPPCADLEHWSHDTVASSVSGNNVVTFGTITTFKVGGLLVPLSVRSCSPSDNMLVWYIGEKIEQIVSIHLQLSHLRMVTYSPLRSQCVSYLGSDSKEFRERCGGFLRVKDAKIVGLIVGSMGMTGETTKVTPLHLSSHVYLLTYFSNSSPTPSRAKGYSSSSGNTYFYRQKKQLCVCHGTFERSQIMQFP